MLQVLLVAFIHGFAGAGVVLTLAISTVGNSITKVVYYILMFSLGGIFGMTAISFAISA